MSFLPEISTFYQLIFKALAVKLKTKFDFDISLLVAILAVGFNNFLIMCIGTYISFSTVCRKGLLLKGIQDKNSVP